jgi:hypothetical protein
MAKIMSLPYDMGNAGDLVKHGLLAEFARWCCEHESQPLRFLDPFAGRPWVGPPNPEVARRVQALPPCALRTAQADPSNRYYGSAFVVLNAARSIGGVADVFVSDSDPSARRAFDEVGLKNLTCCGFSSSDGFTILDADCPGDLVLLDPFSDFLPKRAADVIPKISVASRRMACVLFVLNLDPNNSVGQRYRRLRTEHLASAWSLHCPKLPDRGVAGESRYEVDVLLTWQRLRDHPKRDQLRDRLGAFSTHLSSVLAAEIVFSAA